MRVGLPRDAGQGQPGVGRAGQAVAAHGQEVVGAEEGVEAERLGPLRHPEQLVVGRALLGLDEDAEQHGAQPTGSALRSVRGRRPVRGAARGAGQRRGAAARQTAAMDIGVVFPQTEVGQDHGAVRAIGQAADDLGYTHLAAYDHVLGGDTDVHGDLGGPYTIHHPFREPLTMFAYLAGCTTNLAFATSILIGPQRQTALLAKQAAELDILCGGRFRLGLGIGWNKVEYDALGVPFGQRAAILEEQVAVLRALWTHESVTIEGRFHHITAAGIAPLPVQRPIPDLDRRLRAGRAAPGRPCGRRLVPPRPAGRRAGGGVRSHPRGRSRGRPRPVGVPVRGTARLRGPRPREARPLRRSAGATPARATSPSSRCTRGSRRPTRTSARSRRWRRCCCPSGDGAPHGAAPRSTGCRGTDMPT